MKKLISILLAFLMLFTLTACGGDSGSSSKKKSAIIGVWKVVNEDTGEHAFIEISEDKMTLTEGLDSISYDCTVEEDKVILIDGKDKVDMPFTLNKDKTINLGDFVLEKASKDTIVKEQEKIIKEKEEAEKKAAEEAAKYKSITIDLDPSYLKYKTITFDNDYVKSNVFGNSSSFTFTEEDSIEGIEIYGYYQDSFEGPENFEKYENVTYNIPNEIDGLPVISILGLQDVVPTGVNYLYLETVCDYNIPDSVLLLSYVGSETGLCHVSDSIRYFEGGTHYDAIDKIPADLRYWGGCIYTNQKEIEFKDIIIGPSATIDGEIDTIILGDFVPFDHTSIRLGNDEETVYSKNHHVKNVIYNVQEKLEENVENVSVISICADNVKITDNAALNNYISMYSLFGPVNLEIDSNIKYFTSGYPNPGIEIPHNLGTFTNYCEDLEELISYKTSLKNKEAVIYNKSGAVINWTYVFSDVYDAEFETGKLDFGKYYIEVKK